MKRKEITQRKGHRESGGGACESQGEISLRGFCFLSPEENLHCNVAGGLALVTTFIARC